MQQNSEKVSTFGRRAMSEQDISDHNTDDQDFGPNDADRGDAGGRHGHGRLFGGDTGSSPHEESEQGVAEALQKTAKKKSSRTGRVDKALSRVKENATLLIFMVTLCGLILAFIRFERERPLSPQLHCIESEPAKTPDNPYQVGIIKESVDDERAAATAYESLKPSVGEQIHIVPVCRSLTSMVAPRAPRAKQIVSKANAVSAVRERIGTNHLISVERGAGDDVHVHFWQQSGNAEPVARQQQYDLSVRSERDKLANDVRQYVVDGEIARLNRIEAGLIFPLDAAKIDRGVTGIAALKDLMPLAADSQQGTACNVNATSAVAVYPPSSLLGMGAMLADFVKSNCGSRVLALAHAYRGFWCMSMSEIDPDASFKSGMLSCGIEEYRQAAELRETDQDRIGSLTSRQNLAYARYDLSKQQHNSDLFQQSMKEQREVKKGLIKAKAEGSADLVMLEQKNFALGGLLELSEPEYPPSHSDAPRTKIGKPRSESRKTADDRHKGTAARKRSQPGAPGALLLHCRFATRDTLPAECRRGAEEVLVLPKRSGAETGVPYYRSYWEF
jgi:hypothetical protein